LKLLPALILLAAACVSSAQRPAEARFDGARAYEHVKELVAIGPRPAGSTGAQKTRDYIKKQLSALGLTVTEQAFDAATPIGPIRMVNVRATLGPSSSRRLVIASHYDTKLFKDAAFVGANDGGSSTGFLIELAGVLKQRAPDIQIELLFLDGEEAVLEWQGNDNTYGSRHYVSAAARDGTLKQIGALVLVDMIGDRDLRIKRESHSTQWLTEIIWARAKALGRSEFVAESTPILDDHVPFLEAGVPAVDLIDLEYPDWHQPTDTLDKVSAESLQAVGDVLLAALPDIVARVK
jgi:Zn-dependent M28 family amino/carboxypeptidase